MAEESSENKSSSVINKKWLRIVIAVAIGIPILLELSTLFNLVKVQIFGKEHAAGEETRGAEPARELTIGDTLSIDRDLGIILSEMRISVSPMRWEFELGMKTAGRPDYPFTLYIDSLRLNSGSTLSGRKETLRSKMQEELGSVEMEAKWEIPNGDIPRTLFLTFDKAVSTDSVVRANKKIPLGPIPVRYRSEADGDGTDR